MAAVADAGSSLRQRHDGPEPERIGNAEDEKETAPLNAGDKDGKQKHSRGQQMSEVCRSFLISKKWKCVVLVVIGFTPVFGIAAALPPMLEDRGVEGVWYVMHCVVACWLATMFIFNFGAAQHTDPGGCAKLQPTHGTTGQFEMIIETPDQYGRKDVTDALKYAPSFCEHCKHWKPPRAHHCSFCRRCVMRMDHHCPFTGNCIGFRNHGHFILMYMFAILGLTYALIQVVYMLYRGWQNPREHPLWTPLLRSGRFLTGPSGVIVHVIAKFLVISTPGVGIFAVAAVLAYAAVLGFGSPALWLAGTNQTLLESHFPMKEYVQIKPSVYCPLGPGFYNRGWRQNLRDILGPRWMLRLLLPIKGEPDFHIAIAPRPSKVGAEALMSRVQQVETEGVQQEVASVTQLGINPGPAAQQAENTV